MKIALLARNPNLYSHKRLIEAAEARGLAFWDNAGPEISEKKRIEGASNDRPKKSTEGKKTISKQLAADHS